METAVVVTLDGPAASGKTRIGKEVSAVLDYWFFSSGWFFRSFALKLHQMGLSEEDVRDQRFLHAVAHTLIEYTRDQRFIFNCEEIGQEQIEGPIASRFAPHVARVPEVRAAVKNLLQRFSLKAGRSVFEGRDMGTEVFPNADVKIFLTASPEARAQRKRIREIHQGRTPASLDEIAAEIAARDKMDRERPISPLIPAADAIELDSSSWEIEETRDQVVAVVKKKLGIA